MFTSEAEGSGGKGESLLATFLEIEHLNTISPTLALFCSALVKDGFWISSRAGSF
jgi:hypothetical protein